MNPEPMRRPDKVKILQRMCRDLGSRDFRMVELGCYYGESTKVFAREAALVFAIDPWDEAYLEGEDVKSVGRVWEESMAEVEAVFDAMAADFPQIRKIKKKQEDAVEDFDARSLDLVYCDTLHSEEATLSAIDLWTPKLGSGGFMSGHDYDDEFPGVVRAVDARRTDSFRLWGDGNWAYRV